MKLSARNQLTGTVTSINSGEAFADGGAAWRCGGRRQAVSTPAASGVATWKLKLCSR